MKKRSKCICPCHHNFGYTREDGHHCCEPDIDTIKTMQCNIIYRSAVSGLWYTSIDAAGDIDAVKVNGVLFKSELCAQQILDELTKEKPEYSSLLGINPNNTHQARVFFDMYKANDAGENRHPVTVVEELSKTLGFKILNRVPQSLFDGWDFWIEFDKPPKLPEYFRSGIKWKRIGEA